MKRIAFVFVAFILVQLFSPACYAQRDYFGELEKAVPFDAEELIPDISEGISQNDLNIGFFWEMILKAIYGAVPEAAGSFALMLGLILIASILGALRDTVLSKQICEAMELISVLTICTASYSMTSAVFDITESFINEMNTFLGGVLPTMMLLSASSGNASFAAASSAIILSALSMLEVMCASTLFPLLKLLFSVSVSSAVCGAVNLGGVSSTIKKLMKYIFVLSGIVLSAVLMFQKIITKSVDSASLRGLKFAASFVPFVGSSIGEAMATLSGGIGVIRSTFGVSVAVIICAITVVPLLNLLLNKIFIDLSCGISSMLGLGKESGFLSEMSGVVGYLAAVVAFVGTFFTLAVSIIAATEVRI